ncbi:hypothetical protein ASF65_04095 [Aureimonas sp. Leaf324]|jgi:HAD superfamily hydrolase (TIGR01484 family)|nr:hypothetical protein ASF65_04095 [Aureimonas sp. Leaf324]
MSIKTSGGCSTQKRRAIGISSDPIVVFGRSTMFFLALAVDFDGTLASEGLVAAETFAALRRLRESGRRVVLVTGRELRDLCTHLSDLSIFDRVVAENGGVLLDPANGRRTILGAPPPAEFVERLRRRGVDRISVGEVVVATWEPAEQVALEVIRTMGLELQVVFNKGAVMILPTGIGKASGLQAALHSLSLSPHNVAAVGDAENDHALLRASGCGAAVANATESLALQADLRLRGRNGAGVVELVDRLLAEDHALVPPGRHGIALGKDPNGREILIQPFGESLLIFGSSGCGKSTFATALAETFAARRYEFCVIDPEGDYVDLEEAVSIGTLHTPPPMREALRLLQDDSVNLVLDTQALTLAERRATCAPVLQHLADLRASTGRPHWLLVDEAHQLFSETGTPMPTPPPAMIALTAYPESLSLDALHRFDAVVALGVDAVDRLSVIGHRLGRSSIFENAGASAGDAFFWRPRSDLAPVPFERIRPVQDHKRHQGKYAKGDVGWEHSFWFRGPVNALNTPARNLYHFVDLAIEMDDAVWEHHLRAGDYSAWFRRVIGDEDLAREAERIERDPAVPPQQSRQRIRKAIWRRYAAPAGDAG